MNMISENDIKKLYDEKKLNLRIIHEALRQVEIKVQSILESGDLLNQKAFQVLGVGLTILLAVCSALGILITQYSSLMPTLGIGLFLMGAGLLCVSGQLLSCLKPTDYYLPGRNPSTWLQPYVLDGDDQDQALILSYVLLDYEEGIECTLREHKEKAIRFNRAIGYTYYTALATLLYLAGLYLLPVVRSM